MLTKLTFCINLPIYVLTLSTLLTIGNGINKLCFTSSLVYDGVGRLLHVRFFCVELFTAPRSISPFH